MNQILKINGINFGLILGFLSILPTLLGYSLDISYLVSYWTFVYIFLIIIVIGIIAIIVGRKKCGGFISFKQAFLTYFTMLLVSVLLSSAVNYLLVNVIDQNFNQEIKNKQIEMVEQQREWTMEKIESNENMSEEKIEEMEDQFTEAIEKIESSNNYSLVSILKGIVIYLAIFSIFGLLLSTILKRQPK